MVHVTLKLGMGMFDLIRIKLLIMFFFYLGKETVIHIYMAQTIL